MFPQSVHLLKGGWGVVKRLFEQNLKIYKSFPYLASCAQYRLSNSTNLHLRPEFNQDEPIHSFACVWRKQCQKIR